MSDHDDDWLDEEPSPEEFAEAEALARALDRGSADGGLPEDALQTAALLRHGAQGSELGAQRSEAILAEALRSARPRRPRAAAAPWWRWLLPAGLAATAAAAAFAVLVGSPTGGPAPQTAAALPAPSSALLRAQATAAAGDDPSALDRAMASHRVAVVGRLRERYDR